MEKQHIIKKKKTFSTIWHQAFFLCIISIVNKQTRKKKDNKKVILSLPARVNTICKTRQKSNKSSQALSACALFVCIQLISSVMFLFPWTIAVTFCFKCARTSFTCCPSCVISLPHPNVLHLCPTVVSFPRYTSFTCSLCPLPDTLFFTADILTEISR